MNLDHVSISGFYDHANEKSYYKIRAELRESPGKYWQGAFKFIWYHTSEFLAKKSRLFIEGNEIQVLIKDSSDIQTTVNTLSHSITIADNIINNLGNSYFPHFQKQYTEKFG